MIVAATETLRERVELGRVPQGGLLLLGIAAIVVGVALIVWLYRREGEVPTWRKAVLSGIRIVILAAGVILFLDPVRTIERIRDLDAVTVVLVDESASMAIVDRYPTELAGPTASLSGIAPERLPETPRREVARRMLGDGGIGLVDRLAARNPVRVVGFHAGQRPLAEVPRRGTAGTLEMASDGTATDLAAALRAATGVGDGRPVAAVVLVSDGRSNRGEDPAAAAEALARRGIVLHAVGIGDPTEPRNASVIDLAAPNRTLAAEPFRIEVRLRGTGIAGESTRLVVRRRTAGAPAGTGREVKSYRVNFPRDERELTVEVTDRVAKPGRYVYEAALDSLERETTEEDNRTEVDVEVVDEKVRLLLVAGGPSREYRALRALFTRDRTVEVSCWLQSADPDFPQDGNKRLTRFPDTRQRLFEYDVVLLLDAEPSGLGTGWVETLRDLVRERGGGLGLVAGTTSTLSLLQSAEGAILRTVLPVDPDMVRADRALSLGVPRTESWPLEVTREGEAHVLTRLADSPEESAALWTSLPGFYSAFPVDREKPGAVPLLRSSDPRALGRFGPPVVLAAQWYGAGRSFFLATGETWRWRGVAEPVYDRFWLGVVRFLSAGRLGVGRGRLHVETDGDVFSAGERIEVRGRLLGETYEPTGEPVMVLVVRQPNDDEKEVRLAADPTRPGWYRGFVTARTPGWLEVTAPARGGEEPVVRRLKIARPDRELADPRLDRGLLRGLARRTGGRFLEPSEVASLPDLIGDQRERLVVPASSEPLWDRWWTLLILAGLFTAEWTLRKWSGMT